MDNNKCLLLEFVNEDKKISVGYQDWLRNKISGEEEYLNIMEKEIEVEIKWPNCDIAPASVMKKRMRTCEWKTVVAKILSFGGTYMYIHIQDIFNICLYSLFSAGKKYNKNKKKLPKRLSILIKCLVKKV